ncbi:MAG: hypothetical protein WD069_10555 [Planctomycetales bacterium]
MTLFRELRRLFHAWWCVDRIRISPREGRLLVLRPGDMVSVKARTAEIRTRREQPDAVRPRVTYDCRTVDGSARLTIAASNTGEAVSIEWSEGSATISLDQADVEIFSCPSGP